MVSISAMNENGYEEFEKEQRFFVKKRGQILSGISTEEKEGIANNQVPPEVDEIIKLRWKNMTDEAKDNFRKGIELKQMIKNFENNISEDDVFRGLMLRKTRNRSASS
jgi:hypothetical protein